MLSGRSDILTAVEAEQEDDMSKYDELLELLLLLLPDDNVSGDRRLQEPSGLNTWPVDGGERVIIQ